MFQNFFVSLSSAKITQLLFLLILCLSVCESPCRANQTSSVCDPKMRDKSAENATSENAVNPSLCSESERLSECSESCYRIGSPTIVFFRGHSFKPVQYSQTHEHSVLGLGYSTSAYPLVWYPTVKNSQSESLELTWDEATQFCHRYEARLPSRREIKILLGHIGFQSIQEASEPHSNQQMVPKLEGEQWSSTQYEANGKMETYFYDGTHQRMGHTSQLSERKSFRCVADLTEEN